MTDREILAAAAVAAKLSPAKARRLVRRVQDLVVEAVASGGRVAVPGFGVFKAVRRAERRVRNPRTGEELTVPAVTVPSFTAGAELRRRLREAIAERRRRELEAWMERKEREKYVLFDEALMPSLRKEEAGMSEKKETDEREGAVVGGAVEEGESVGSGLGVVPSEGFGSGGGDVEGAGVRESGEGLGRGVGFPEGRLRWVFWGGVAAVAVLLVLSGVLLVRTVALERAMRRWAESQRNETKVSLEELERKVMERFAAMDLDVAQVRETLRREMAQLRSEQERRVEEALRRRLEAEAVRRSGGRRPLVKVIRYTVRKGDNLWRISAVRSGNPYNWVGIYRTNGERIRHPDRIYPGQVILVPVVVDP